MGRDDNSDDRETKHKRHANDRERDADAEEHKSQKRHRDKHRRDEDGSDDVDEGYREKKRKHKEKEKDRHKDKKSKHRHRDKGKGNDKLNIVDDDVDEGDMWVEKNIDMDGERPLAQDIPTGENLKLKSTASSTTADPPLPHAAPTETRLQRDEWMLLPGAPRSAVDENPSTYATRRSADVADESLTEDYGEPSSSARPLGGTVDFFSSLGKDIKQKPPPKPNPEDVKISSKELNKALLSGAPETPSSAPAPAPKPTPGGPGSQWRMMRLARVYESAAEEGRPVEELALERFGSLDAFEDAREERRILDERDAKRAHGRGREDNESQRRGRDEAPRGTERRMMFTDSSASSRSSSFRRPGGAADYGSTPSTPSPAERPSNMRLNALRTQSAGQTTSPLAQSHTPIPSVMTPPPAVTSGGKRALSPSSLNRLQAKVLRAKLMDAPDAKRLEEEYEAEVRRAAGHGGDADESGVRTKVEVLPTLDGRGRLYDVGHGKDDGQTLPGNRRKKEKFETRDPKTGELLRINADDDSTTLGEMLRQERFGAGQADQKDLDAGFAKAIMGDGKFENDLDYIDDNAEKLGRQKMRSDAMKRQFAINDYKKTQKVLASCPYCFGGDDSPPKAPVVAMGTRVYLSCTLTEELVDGHCLIVPIQHCLSMLEGDDDVWDEVRNFMKCLMRMFAEEDKGVVFYETVINLKWQAHTVIECIPLPWDHFEEIPQYFKESILASEAEWSQHKKLIDFSARPGGFRRAMVPNLPYFMVQFDHKGERGYGHVIEGTGQSTADGEEGALEEGEKGGGEFPKYFAGEIIGNVLELEPRRWRRPRRVDFARNKARVAQFRQKYDKFDWTGMIGR